MPARKLRDNGVPEPQAEATVEVVRDATSDLATKADLSALEARMEARLDLLEARMEARMLSAMNRAIGLVIAAMGVIAAIALAIAELT